MQIFADAVATALAAAVQLGLPLVVLAFVGYLNWRLRSLAAQQASMRNLSSDGRFGGRGSSAVRKELACWEAKGCAPENRRRCAAHAHPNWPCWQCRKLTLGRLPGECTTCERFTALPVPS